MIAVALLLVAVTIVKGAMVILEVSRRPGPVRLRPALARPTRPAGR